MSLRRCPDPFTPGYGGSTHASGPVNWDRGGDLRRSDTRQGYVTAPTAIGSCWSPKRTTPRERTEPPGQVRRWHPSRSARAGHQRPPSPSPSGRRVPPAPMTRAPHTTAIDLVLHLKTFAEYPATRNQLGPSHDLVSCGKESARYYTKVFRWLRDFTHAMSATTANPATNATPARSR